MGTPLGPKYIPYTYMDPLGYLKSLLQEPNPSELHYEAQSAGSHSAVIQIFRFGGFP